MRWMPARRILDDVETWVPVQLVYLVDAPVAEEQRIGYATSSGLACGGSLDEAIVSALLELVERDALMLTWFGRLSEPLLDWRDSAALRSEFDAHFAPSRLRFSAVNLSAVCDVPAVLALVRPRAADGVPVAFGSASALSVDRAWRKALCEAMKSRRWLRRLIQEQEDAPQMPSEILDFHDHALFYCSTRSAWLDFFDASSKRVLSGSVSSLESSTPRAAKAALAERLAANGVDAYAVDLTTPEVADVGLAVVRVIAPQLYPMSVGWGFELLGDEARLNRLRSARGLAESTARNLPHPFP